MQILEKPCKLFSSFKSEDTFQVSGGSATIAKARGALEADKRSLNVASWEVNTWFHEQLSLEGLSRSMGFRRLSGD
jgi:hypothetical protein